MRKFQNESSDDLNQILEWMNFSEMVQPWDESIKMQQKYTWYYLGRMYLEVLEYQVSAIFSCKFRRNESVLELLVQSVCDFKK